MESPTVEFGSRDGAVEVWRHNTVTARPVTDDEELADSELKCAEESGFGEMGIVLAAIFAC